VVKIRWRVSFFRSALLTLFLMQVHQCQLTSSRSRRSSASRFAHQVRRRPLTPIVFGSRSRRSRRSFIPRWESRPRHRRAQLQWHVAEKAAVLIGAAAWLHEAFPEAAPARAANGRSLEAQNETMKIYMREYRARRKAEKAGAQ
jgi:hypothetical protein